MATNYLQFCTELKLRNKKEVEWWSRNLTTPDDNPDNPKGLDFELFKKIVSDVTGDDTWDFAYRLNAKSKSLELFTEESGDPYQVCCLVHVFLKEMRPDAGFTFHLTWAETSIPSRYDEFCGGTMVATAAGVGTCNVEDQADFAKGSIINPWV